MSLFHWLAHKTGRNTGHISTWWYGDKLMVGFLCHGCGKIEGEHESFTTRDVDYITREITSRRAEQMLIQTIRKCCEALDLNVTVASSDDLVRKVADMCKEVDRLRGDYIFYKRRCEALQRWQSSMRDPERTVVCDILANGFTLDQANAGDRYGGMKPSES